LAVGPAVIAFLRRRALTIGRLMDETEKIAAEVGATERWEAARKWYEENKAAVDAYNDFVDKHGLFSDGVRKF
jgi:post-segregation antitoxin (ccd killing protein)